MAQFTRYKPIKYSQREQKKGAVFPFTYGKKVKVREVRGSGTKWLEGRYIGLARRKGEVVVRLKETHKRRLSKKREKELNEYLMRYNKAYKEWAALHDKLRGMEINGGGNREISAMNKRREFLLSEMGRLEAICKSYEIKGSGITRQTMAVPVKSIVQDKVPSRPTWQPLLRTQARKFSKLSKYSQMMQNENFIKRPKVVKKGEPKFIIISPKRAQRILSRKVGAVVKIHKVKKTIEKLQFEIKGHKQKAGN